VYHVRWKSLHSSLLYNEAKTNLLVVEAKKSKIEEAYSQLYMEMIAVQKTLDPKRLYGAVTTGELWRFVELKDNVFLRDGIYYSAIAQMQEIIEIISGILDGRER